MFSVDRKISKGKHGKTRQLVVKWMDNKNVFENDDQMMNFLDNLNDKKKN